MRPLSQIQRRRSTYESTWPERNEPQCFVGLGFLQGCHAPGVKAPLRDTFEMAHNALKAHGRAVQIAPMGNRMCRSAMPRPAVCATRK